MGWIAFTAIDLWIGLIILEAMLPTLPEAMAARARKVSQTLVGSIALLAVAFVALLVKRWIAPK